MRHHSDDDGPSCSTPPFAIHGDATSLRLLTHGIETIKIEHVDCQNDNAHGRRSTCRRGGMREGLWCATIVMSMAPLALHRPLPYMGTQPPCVCSLTAYKQRRCSTFPVRRPCARLAVDMREKNARERRWHGYELCARLILLAVAFTHAGTQVCVVTSLISYKRLR